VQIVSDYLHRNCGRWFDDEVATLTEIAFPGKQLSSGDVAKLRSSGTFDRKNRS
jgi:hypothetical protein